MDSAALPTTRVLDREASAMNRTDDVKQRLGPIMERVKSSLARIQALEQSLAKDQVNDTSEAVAVGRTVFVSGIGQVETRHFLKRSMGMLKGKISTLQQMEESLSRLEDRREHLQHYILQVSLSRPMMELASTRRRNLELELHVFAVEQDLRKLQEKEAAANILHESSQNVQEFEEFQLHRNSIRSHDCGFEQVSMGPTPVTSANSLQSHDSVYQAKQINPLSTSQQQVDDEDRGESEVVVDMFTRTEVLGCYTKSRDSVRSSCTAMTDPDTDSSTVNSVPDMETSSESQDVNVSASHSQSKQCDEYSSIPLNSSIDSSDAHEVLLDSLHDVGTELTYDEFDENIHSLSVSHQGQGAALTLKLLARIKKLEQDNRELKELVSLQIKHTTGYCANSCCSARDRESGQ